VANRLGSRLDFDRVWGKQGASHQLMEQIATWAGEVNEELHRSAGGRMISEWAKRPECKEAVMGANYSPPSSDIPELRQS